MENLALLSDDALLSGVEVIVGVARQVEVRLLAYLGEIEERRLDLRSGYSSLFDFCTTKLRLSEGEAYRRIVGARLLKRYPVIAGLLDSGALNLTGLELLRPHLTDENHRELFAEASLKKKGEILELLARRFPKPDVPDTIRKRPARRGRMPAAPEAAELRVEPTASGAAPSDLRAASSALQLEPQRGHGPTSEPLSPGRYAVRFTATAELRDKLERAKHLMSHQNPSLDLAVVVERALDLLIAELEKKKLGKTARPRKARPAKPGTITRAARRAATERDGAQCAWVNEKTGRRCSARAFLELDHITPKALGGSGNEDNARWLCRAHNQLHAEQTFGRRAVQRAIHFRQQKQEQSDQQRRTHLRQQMLEHSHPQDDEQPRVSQPSEVYSKALAGLEGLGFRATEARAAIARVRLERANRAPEPSPELVLRKALSVLSEARASSA